MVSRPDISTCRVLRSVWSALPRMEPIAFWKKDSDGLEEILRSRARRRDRLAESMSLVAERPACLREISISVTGLGRAQKFCQGELTAAKPESRAMSEMPMTPTRSRHPSMRRPGLSMILFWLCLSRRVWPLHQNPQIQSIKPVAWSTHASLNLPLACPVYFQPAAEMIECNSSDGIATMSENRRRRTVVWRANPRAAGLTVFDISQRISSARTAAKATVVENVRAEKSLITGDRCCVLEDSENRRELKVALKT